MIDHDTEGDSAESAGAPVNRDARRDPGVIEGEIAAREPADKEAPPGPTAAERGAEPSAAPVGRRQSGARGFIGGALAGLIVSALGLGAGYTLMAPRTELSGIANRLSATEAQARQDSAALAANSKRDSAVVATLDKRVSALEAGAATSNTADLDKRVAALEAANAGNGANSAAGAEAAQRLAALDKDLRGDIDAERGAISDLAARVTKLEAETQKAIAAGADVGALAGRIDKIETALAAPKNETQIVADKLAATDDATAIAIIAEVAEEKLRSGAGLAPELASLQRLGVDSAALASLQAVVNGAPTNATLAASFDAIAAESAGRDIKGRARRDRRALPRPYPRSRPGARSERDSRRRSASVGLADRGLDPARRHRRRAGRIRQAAGSRASRGGRLGDASPREASGGRGASVDPRGCDRAARGRPKTVRPQPSSEASFGGTPAF